MKNHLSFLVVGKTQESKESTGFKRYVGLAASHVLAFNPKKSELDALMGFESANEPEYLVDTDNGKEVRLTFIVRTDPDSNNGIEITNRFVFTLRNKIAYSSDQSKIQVLDNYGNAVWIPAEDAKAGKALEPNMKAVGKYHIACDGEAALTDFLRTYLGVPYVLTYTNGAWGVNDRAKDGEFILEHLKDYFKGDFSEIKEALAMQPNNKIKLLYGVRTTDDNKQYQVICSRVGFFLRNNAGSKAIAKLEKDLADAKNAGAFANIEYKVQELQEYTVQPTNLSEISAQSEDASSELPWD